MKHSHSFFCIVPALFFLLLLNSCEEPTKESPYLRVKQADILLSPAAGSEAMLVVESNIIWQVELSREDAGWLRLDRTTGLGNDTIRIIAFSEVDDDTLRIKKLNVVSLEPKCDLRLQVTVTQGEYNP